MTLHKPLLMQPAGGDPDATYSGSELRALFAALYPFDGIIGAGQNPGGFLVAQRGAGANLSVDVAAGLASVNGDDVAGQNVYLCWSDATSNLVMPAAPGSGTRTHRVGLRIRDKLASGSWTTYEFLPDVVQDTGSGFPAEPASFLTLGSAAISAGQSSYQTAQLTDMRPVNSPTGAWRKWKTADLPGTSLTAVADSDLANFRVIAGRTYKVTAGISYSGGNVGLLFGFSAPASSSGEYECSFRHYGDAAEYSLTAYSPWTQTNSGKATSGQTPALQVTGNLICTVTGTLSFIWGSVTGSTVTVKAGSWMEITPVA